MVDAIEIDASDFVRAAVDMGRGLKGLAPEVRKSVSKAANQVKKGMAADLRASQHFQQVAPTVDYDLRSGDGIAEAEVGPNEQARVPSRRKRRRVGPETPAPLAIIAYFGGSSDFNGGGGTVRDPKVHLEIEAPNFERGIGEILDRLLG